MMTSNKKKNECSERVKRFLEGTPDLIVQSRQEQSKYPTASQSSPAPTKTEHFQKKNLYGDDERLVSASPPLIDLTSDDHDATAKQQKQQDDPQRACLVERSHKFVIGSRKEPTKKRSCHAESLANFLYGPELVQPKDEQTEKNFTGTKYVKSPHKLPAQTSDESKSPARILKEPAKSTGKLFDFSEYAFHHHTGVFFICSFCPHKEELKEWLYVKEKRRWCLQLGQFHRCNTKSIGGMDKNEKRGDGSKYCAVSKKSLPDFARKWPTIFHPKAKELLRGNGLMKVKDVPCRPCVSVSFHGEPTVAVTSNQGQEDRTSSHRKPIKKRRSSENCEHNSCKESATCESKKQKQLLKDRCARETDLEINQSVAKIQEIPKINHVPLKKRAFANPSHPSHDIPIKACALVTPRPPTSMLGQSKHGVVTPESQRQRFHRDIAPARICCPKDNQVLKQAMFYELLLNHPWADRHLVDHFIQNAQLYR